MEEQNPYLKELSEDLSSIWSTENRFSINAEIEQLSQANMLQLSLATRLAAAKQLLRIKLITDDLILGQLLRTGADAVLIRSSMTVQLIPLTSIEYVAQLPKAGNPNQLRKLLFVPVLFEQLKQRIIVDFKSGERIMGELVEIWQDCFDIIIANQVITISFNQVLKIELGS
jgi:hypothetical protein